MILSKYPGNHPNLFKKQKHIYIVSVAAAAPDALDAILVRAVDSFGGTSKTPGENALLRVQTPSIPAVIVSVIVSKLGILDY